jgi:hypothetical protein
MREYVIAGGEYECGKYVLRRKKPKRTKKKNLPNPNTTAGGGYLRAHKKKWC